MTEEARREHDFVPILLVFLKALKLEPKGEGEVSCHRMPRFKTTRGER